MSALNEKFKKFTAKTYSEQSAAFLNAYWSEHQSEAELIWGWTNLFINLDIDKGKQGVDLDEFNAHRFLEKLGETRTIKEMRDELREIDMDFNRRISIIEFLLFKYKKTVSDFCSRPQGNQDEVEIAQRALNEAKESLDIAQKARHQSEEAANFAKEQAEAARLSAEEAKKSLKKLREELMRLLEHLMKQERMLKLLEDLKKKLNKELRNVEWLKLMLKRN